MAASIHFFYDSIAIMPLDINTALPVRQVSEEHIRAPSGRRARPERQADEAKRRRGSKRVFFALHGRADSSRVFRKD
jgi:hypothetical protein